MFYCFYLAICLRHKVHTTLVKRTQGYRSSDL